MASLTNDLLLALASTDVVAFIDERLQRTELGQPFQLMDHQRVILREAFAFEADGRLRYDTIIYSCPKKSGKTTINATVTVW
jgi:phage terminase large subunit-like protein